MGRQGKGWACPRHIQHKLKFTQQVIAESGIIRNKVGPAAVVQNHLFAMAPHIGGFSYRAAMMGRQGRDCMLDPAAIKAAVTY
jgi:hypothetical protein